MSSPGDPSRVIRADIQGRSMHNAHILVYFDVQMSDASTACSTSDLSHRS